MAWGFAGRKLSIGWALALCQHVGFRGSNLRIAVALMTAESGRYTEAWHENILLPEPGSTSTFTDIDSTDRGLFQINDKWHPDLLDPFNPISNVRYAYQMSGNGLYFTAWAAYNSHAYYKYLLPVYVVRVLGLWKGKIHRVERELG